MDIALQNVMKTVIKYISLSGLAVVSAWSAGELSGPPMCGAPCGSSTCPASCTSPGVWSLSAGGWGVGVPGVDAHLGRAPLPPWAVAWPAVLLLLSPGLDGHLAFSAYLSVTGCEDVWSLHSTLWDTAPWDHVGLGWSQG